MRIGLFISFIYTGLNLSCSELIKNFCLKIQMQDNTSSLSIFRLVIKTENFINC